MNTLTLTIDEGNLLIREDELPSITDAELASWRISGEELHRCFAEGVALMHSAAGRERARPVAHETYDGKWKVVLVGYSPLTDTPTRRDNA